MKGDLKRLFEEENFRNVVKLLNKEISTFVIGGLFSSSKSYYLSCLANSLDKNILLITSNFREAEKIFNDFIVFFPFFNTFLISEHISNIFPKILFSLSSNKKTIVISSISSLFSPIMSKNDFEKNIFKIYKDEDISKDDILENCIKLGYKNTAYVEEIGQISSRGGIIDVFSPLHENPVRIELFGEKIYSLRFFEIDSQKSIKEIKEVFILPTCEFILKGNDTLLKYFSPSNSIIVIDEEKRIEQEAKNLNYKYFLELKKIWGKYPSVYFSLLEDENKKIKYSVENIPIFSGDMNAFLKTLKNFMEKNISVFVYTMQSERLKDYLSNEGISGINIIKENLSSGFLFTDLNLAIITEKEIFSKPFIRYSSKFFKKEISYDEFSEVKKGDFVVHIDHGIAKFSGIERLQIEGYKKDYFLLQYAGQDKLYVPVEQVNRIQKYNSIDGSSPKLNRLGGTLWQWTKRKVKKSTESIAKELLELYREREQISGFSFSPDTVWQKEMELSFPYEETSDQIKATEESKRDMESIKPMDRLVCGDVGYGKTEVGIRCAFKAIMDGKQVAVLVPTTILAEQHYNTFKERLATFPINIEMLSRFKTKKEQKEIIEGLKNGNIDLIIGTHRLIQEDIEFKDLGLLIIDEEQRFGVSHKEKLKQLKKNVDVLTLTATPIPRTLYLSLLKIRDISIIDTPPSERLSIITYLGEYSKDKVKEAIEKEIARGGQVFFVHNQIENIEKIKSHLQDLVPYAKIGIAHGKLANEVLEKTMLDFMNGSFDILLCTTIIESGVDIPNANTIIISGVEKFGLAQIYQLRGRVGRSNKQAYCYLFYYSDKLLSTTAWERLLALKEFTDLGSGFKLAKKDLEIRGAGNLLGREQSGFVNQVGFELYCQLLSEEISELKKEKVEEKIEPKVEININAYIPDEYILDLPTKLSYYKRLSGIEKIEEIISIEKELNDRYGKIPKMVKNLLQIILLKILAKNLGITHIKYSDNCFICSLSHPINIPKNIKEVILQNGKIIIQSNKIDFLENILKKFKRDIT